MDVCARVAAQSRRSSTSKTRSVHGIEVSAPRHRASAAARERDFRRFAGFGVKVKLKPGLERRRYSGVLRGLDGQVLVEADGQIHKLH